MPKRIAPFLLLLCVLLPALSEGQVITGPDIKLINSEIHVSFSFGPESKRLQEMREGIDKEFRFYIDLFRVWKVWPDEFVLGKTYIRTLKSDPIKQEHIATSNDGAVLIEKRFRSFESMLEWTFSVKDLRLSSTRELDPGQYFVRITVESKVRKLPPVINHFMLFISENEFKVVKDSGLIMIEGNR